MNCPSCGQISRESANFCDSCGARLLVDSRESTSSQTQLETSSGFVGRQRELRELQEALDGVLAGQGRLVMLAGEPGIGKQSLPLGWLLGGVMSTLLGNVVTLVICAFMFIGFNLLAYLRSSQLREI